MLKIENLKAKVENKEILKGINLEVKPGEIHAVMGPNGAGKSTLSSVIAGKESFTVTEGSIDFKGKDLLALEPEIRAREGIFVAFQYPVEIPGVNNTYFLRAALNARLKHQGKEEIDAMDFMGIAKEKMAAIGIKNEMLKRSINDGFSGGEKKRNEILQLSILDPELAILDETDSGLDVDALKLVAEGVQRFFNQDKAIILITHYHKLLEYLNPHKVHILQDGKITMSGDMKLAEELEKNGYDNLLATQSK